jgi:hypothetical protein
MERRKELKKLFTVSMGSLSSIMLVASAGLEGYLGHTTEMGQDLVVAMVVGMNTFFLSEAEEVGEQIITGTVMTDLVQITNIVKSGYYPSNDLRTDIALIGRVGAFMTSVASQTFFFI